MHRVTTKDGVLWAESGTLLSDLLLAHAAVDHPCGGRGVCRKCMVLVDGQPQLSCQYRIESDIAVSGYEKQEILSETGVHQTSEVTEQLCFALDMGTTTLALALVSLDQGSIVRVVTATNPQRVYGADVMTRIEHCRKEGVQALQDCVVGRINVMIRSLDAPEVETMYVSGNVTMLHMLFGVDCASIGVAPYTPVFLEKQSVPGKDLGLQGVQIVESLPSIASFVGADLVAGMNYVGMPPEGKFNLIIDLGTNAEIVLYSAAGALCTAAAAGPCFEGANITCGSSAVCGAIYADEGGAAKTVSDAPAKSICGTGLVDVMAALLREKIMDETGYMGCEKFFVSGNVFVDQQDVRQYQLAKSAICAGILTLLSIWNVSFADIETMYISGGFSAKINVENAVFTGLLPKQLEDKCVAIHNSSLLGTVKYACQHNDLSGYRDQARYVDLSANQVFGKLFVENMTFLEALEEA